MVISLDFELHWGMRDHVGPGDAATAELVKSRHIVTELATMFGERGIRSTWATVGMLFASSRDELTPFLPSKRPKYARHELDPYQEAVGEDEDSDPLHLAGSLVRQVASTPGQEVGSHTFSHYYCLEDGQDEEAFRADLAAAQAIATRSDLALSSLVLPRNQWNPAYARACLDNGFSCYRGPQPSWQHRAQRMEDAGPVRRLARLADTYVGGGPPPTTAWDHILDPVGLCNVPASAFLRPYSPATKRLEALRRSRLFAGLRDAARRSRIFHLWWHPHNFARHPDGNFDILRRVLDEFAVLARTEGMRSLSMGDVATLITGRDDGH
jgi:hypothetical protein